MSTLIYLGEETLNSLFTLSSKSFRSNESYENKIRILKNEKILLNDANYTKHKTEKSVRTQKAFDGYPTKSIFDNLVAAGNFNILINLLTAVGLKDILSGNGQFTLFALTDQGFANQADLFGITVDQLITSQLEKPELLKEVLRYHLVARLISTAEMVDLNGQKILTMSGEKWTVVADGQTLSIKGGLGTLVNVNVIDSNIVASNGFIHIIDKVISGSIIGNNPDDSDQAVDFSPYDNTFNGSPTTNIFDDLVASGSFKIFTELLTVMGLKDKLSGGGPYTVFAFTDQAFKNQAVALSLSTDALIGVIRSYPDLLKEILLYHMLPKKISAAEMLTLNGQQLKTLSGEKWTVVVSGQTVSIRDGYRVLVKVIDTDIAASNGVIHVIDAMLNGAAVGVEVDVATALENFFIDGNYYMNILLMPSAGVLNGAVYSNLITKISSKRSITTNNLLQKSIRNINDDTEADKGIFQSFNINSVAVSINAFGTSLVGNYKIGLDKCDIRYTGFAFCQQNIVTIEVKWQKSTNGSYFATSYVVDDVNDQQLNFSGVLQLTRMP